MIARDGNDGVLRWSHRHHAGHRVAARTTGGCGPAGPGAPRRSGTRDVHTDSLVDGTSASCNVRMMHMDGTFSWFAVHVDLVCSASGKRLGRIGTWRPIDGEVGPAPGPEAGNPISGCWPRNATDLVIRISQDGPSRGVTLRGHHLGWGPRRCHQPLPAQFLHPHDADEMVARVMSLTIADPQLGTGTPRSAGRRHLPLVLGRGIASDRSRRAPRRTGHRSARHRRRSAKSSTQKPANASSAAMDAAPGGMAVSDLEGSLPQVNKAHAMLGRPTQWLTEHRIDDVLHPATERSIASCVQIPPGSRRQGRGEPSSAITDGTVVWSRTAPSVWCTTRSGAPVLRVAVRGYQQAGSRGASWFPPVTTAHPAVEPTDPA